MDDALAGCAIGWEPGFIGGVWLHTGLRAFRLADRIIAAPMSTFWA